MSTYPVRVFGDPVLKQKAKDVTDIDGQLARFVDTMVDTMYEASGVGLAAPQVGVQKRMFTFDVGEGPQVLINPEVAEATGEWAVRGGVPLHPRLPLRDRATEGRDDDRASTSTATRSSSRATSSSAGCSSTSSTTSTAC